MELRNADRPRLALLVPIHVIRAIRGARRIGLSAATSADVPSLPSRLGASYGSRWRHEKGMNTTKLDWRFTDAEATGFAAAHSQDRRPSLRPRAGPPTDHDPFASAFARRLLDENVTIGIDGVLFRLLCAAYPDARRPSLLWIAEDGTVLFARCARCGADDCTVFPGLARQFVGIAGHSVLAMVDFAVRHPLFCARDALSRIGSLVMNGRWSGRDSFAGLHADGRMALAAVCEGTQPLDPPSSPSFLSVAIAFGSRRGSIVVRTAGPAGIGQRHSLADLASLRFWASVRLAAARSPIPVHASKAPMPRPRKGVSPCHRSAC